MAYIFADEAGNFDFSPRGSAYFVVTAVLMWEWADCAGKVLQLRHDLAKRGTELMPEGFHATEDKQAVRDEFMNLITSQQLFIHSVVMEKRKANPSVRADENSFYQLGWNYLFRWMVHKHLLGFGPKDLHVIASTLGTRAKLNAFENAVSSVVDCHVSRHTTTCWTAASHPCLQIADYCCWAIGRKYERNDSRSFDIIKPKIKSCFELFKRGTTLYY